MSWLLWRYIGVVGSERMVTVDLPRGVQSGLSDAERIRVLERENAKLREERELLRKAAKYFAEETNW